MQHISLEEQFKRFGYANFQFEILDRIKFSDWNDLYDVENEHIIKFDSISNGYNTIINKTYIHI